MLIMEINGNQIFNTSELMNEIRRAYPNLKSASLYRRIREMEKKGSIARIGKSLYIGKPLHTFSYSLESALARRVLRQMKKSYSSDLEYVVYESSTVLNRFLNHLLAQTYVIVEVPRDFVEPVFFNLKEAGFRNVLLNPDSDGLFRYGENGTIIVRRLISKAPILQKQKRITIEKLAVDIVADDLLHCLFEGAEIPTMVEEIMTNYKVRIDTLCNYAKRRHATDALLRCAPDEMKGLLKR